MTRLWRFFIFLLITAAGAIAAFTFVSSEILIAIGGSEDQFSYPIWQWWITLAEADADLTLWVILSGLAGGLLSAVALIAFISAFRYTLTGSAPRLRPQDHVPEPPDPAISDNFGHASWASLDDVLAEFSSPDPSYGAIVLGEAYDPRMDTGPFRPLNKSTWGHGGKAPLLLDACHTGSTHSLIIAGSGSFKAQPLDATVLTPTGFRAMRDLRVGDPIQTPDGRAVPIIGIYPQGTKDVYRITFRDGRQVECCNDHLWKVWTRWHHTSGPGRLGKIRGIRRARVSTRTMEWRVLPLSKIRDRFENRRSMWKSLAVPLVHSSAIEFPSKTLPIPPYTLGVLLGDGRLQSTGAVALSTADDYIKTAILQEMADYELVHVTNYDYRFQLKRHLKTWTNQTQYTPLSGALRTLGLHGLKSHHKFIPAIYKAGSSAQRLALLQGLMDTDGAAQGSRATNIRTYGAFVTTSEQLARDVQELAWSLGAIASSRKRKGYYTQNGIRKNARDYWRLQIIHSDVSMFFSLPRKVEQFAHKTMRHRLNILAIDYVGKKTTQCIQIADLEGLYVTDNYVVTHNTVCAVSTLLTWTGAAVVLDPAEELGPMLERDRRRLGHNVFVLSPQSAGSTGFNVLDWIDTRSPLAEPNVDAVVEWISGYTSRRDQTAQFFKDQGKALIRCMLTQILWDPDLPQAAKTLRTLRRFIARPEAELRDGLKAIASAGDDAPSQRAKQIASTLFDLVKETFSGVYANANLDTEWLSTTAYCDLVSGNSFKTSDIANGNTDVFLSLPLKALEATPAIARCIIGALLNSAYEADGAVKGRILFLLDEAARLGPMGAIKVAFNAGRKYGITLQFLYQSIGQIEQQWGREGKHDLYEGAAFRSYAALNDIETAEELAKTIGQRGVRMISESANTGLSVPQFSIFGSRQRGTSYNYSEMGRFLIRPEELLHDLRTDAQILIPQAAKPILCGRAPYFRKPEFVRRVDANRFTKGAA